MLPERPLEVDKPLAQTPSTGAFHEENPLRPGTELGVELLALPKQSADVPLQGLQSRRLGLSLYPGALVLRAQREISLFRLVLSTSEDSIRAACSRKAAPASAWVRSCSRARRKQIGGGVLGRDEELGQALPVEVPMLGDDVAYSRRRSSSSAAA